MKDYLKNYNTSNLKLVQIRQYNGIEDGHYSWTFLGYDFVEEENGKITSILASDDVEYTYVDCVYDERRGHDVIDHRSLKKDEVRVVVEGDRHNSIFMGAEVVSLAYLKKWIKNNPSYHFKYYKPEENKNIVEKGKDKVKAIGKKNK